MASRRFFMALGFYRGLPIIIIGPWVKEVEKVFLNGRQFCLALYDTADTTLARR
jgi:hypothetical protein